MHSDKKLVVMNIVKQAQKVKSPFFVYICARLARIMEREDVDALLDALINEGKVVEYIDERGVSWYSVK